MSSPGLEMLEMHVFLFFDFERHKSFAIKLNWFRTNLRISSKPDTDLTPMQAEVPAGLANSSTKKSNIGL